MYSLLHRYYSTLLEWKWCIGRLHCCDACMVPVTCLAKSHNRPKKCHVCWPRLTLNVSRRLSASAELLVLLSAPTRMHNDNCAEN